MTTTAGIVWTRRPLALADDIEVYARRVERAVARAAQRLAAILEADAQLSAPWRDQTGAARRALFAATDVAGDLVAVYLSHGASVPYGVYLETANAARYAVIWPTLERHLDEIWDLIRQELT